MIQVGCQVYILLAVYQEESIFMLLILFDLMSIIFICSTDRICICLQKLAKLHACRIYELLLKICSSKWQ